LDCGNDFSMLEYHIIIIIKFFINIYHTQLPLYKIHGKLTRFMANKCKTNMAYA